MAQEIGETVEEMKKADARDVEKILNRRPTDHYWIVICHKPTKMRLDTGQQVIMRLVKDYNKKPEKLLGTLVLEVKNGEIIKEEIYPLDAPINWNKIDNFLGFEKNPGLIKDSNIAQSYLYTERG